MTEPSRPDPTRIDMPASAWIRRWTPLIASGGSVLDVACGSGRHTRWFAQRGFRVTAVDRDAAAVHALAGIADEVVDADLEAAAWPFPGRTFDAIVVTNYLWRALTPTLVASLADGGVLLMETFAAGNELVGRPRHPNFLLRTAELLEMTQGLRVVAFEDGFLRGPDRFVQRVAALRNDPGAGLPHRYPLDGEAASAAG